MSDKDIDFLMEAARYFERRDIEGEDRAFWANVYNAENCRRIADRLRAIDPDQIRQEALSEFAMNGPAINFIADFLDVEPGAVQAALTRVIRALAEQKP